MGIMEDEKKGYNPRAVVVGPYKAIIQNRYEFRVKIAKFYFEIDFGK